MTTENVDLQQVAEAVAAQVNGQAAAPPAAPQPLTREELISLMDTRDRQLLAQVSGLASKIDTGLNAVRRDTRTWAEQQIGELRTTMGRQKYLDSLDEEQRKIAEPLLAEMDRRNPQPSSPAQEVQQPAGDPVQLWNDILRISAEAKVNPYDESIGLYKSMATNLPNEENLRLFRQNIQAVKAAVQPAAPAPQRTAAPANNPPIETQAASRVGGYRNADDVRDAYIMDRIDKEQYRKALATFGQQP